MKVLSIQIDVTDLSVDSQKELSNLIESKVKSFTAEVISSHVVEVDEETGDIIKELDEFIGDFSDEVLH